MWAPGGRAGAPLAGLSRVDAAEGYALRAERAIIRTEGRATTRGYLIHRGVGLLALEGISAASP